MRCATIPLIRIPIRARRSLPAPDVPATALTILFIFSAWRGPPVADHVVHSGSQHPAYLICEVIWYILPRGMRELTIAPCLVLTFSQQPLIA